MQIDLAPSERAVVVVMVVVLVLANVGVGSGGVCGGVGGDVGCGDGFAVGVGNVGVGSGNNADVGNGGVGVGGEWRVKRPKPKPVYDNAGIAAEPTAINHCCRSTIAVKIGEALETTPGRPLNRRLVGVGVSARPLRSAGGVEAAALSTSFPKIPTDRMD